MRLWLRWHERAAVAVELWQAGAWVVLLWKAMAGNPQPRNERFHCWAPPQAMLLLWMVPLVELAPLENQGAEASHECPWSHLHLEVAPQALGQSQLLAQPVVQRLPFQRESPVGGP